MNDVRIRRLKELLPQALEELEKAGSHFKDLNNHYERIGATKWFLSEAIKELKELP